MFRNYTRKYDMEEPPKFEEPLDEADNRSKRIASMGGFKEEEDLEERFFK